MFLDSLISRAVVGVSNLRQYLENQKNYYSFHDTIESVSISLFFQKSI